MFKFGRNKKSEAAPAPANTQIAQPLSKAEQALDDPEMMRRFKQVLTQVAAHYENRRAAGELINPIWAGITPGGTFVEVSKSPDAAKSDNVEGVFVFTYTIGAEVPQQGIEPRGIGTTMITRGFEHHILLDGGDYPRPTSGGRAISEWNFRDAETVTVNGLFRQPEGVTFGHGIASPGAIPTPHSPREPVLPLEQYARQIQ